MKFLSNADLVWHWGLFTRSVVLSVWTAIALLIVFYLLGKFQMSGDSQPTTLSPQRLLFAIAALALAVWLASGLLGQPMGELEAFLPAPDRVQASNSTQGEPQWIDNDYQAALAKAKQQGKPLFIDFTGYTCTNCRWMEANMFPRAEVQSQLGNFVRLHLYTDGDGVLYDRQQQMEKEYFGTIALPYYALVSPAGKTIATFPGLTRNSNEFIAFLEKASVGVTEAANVPGN